MSALREKYFRYRSRNDSWIYTYVNDEGINFSSDIKKARPLSPYEMKSAFELMKLKTSGVFPEQMTEEEFSIVRIIDS